LLTCVGVLALSDPSSEQQPGWTVRHRPTDLLFYFIFPVFIFICVFPVFVFQFPRALILRFSILRYLILRVLIVSFQVLVDCADQDLNQQLAFKVMAKDTALVGRVLIEPLRMLKLQPDTALPLVSDKGHQG
jgi:hypothetical protein